MQRCSAAWQEDGLCSTSKHAWHSGTHISLQSIITQSIFIVSYIFNVEKKKKCMGCFYAHPLTPLTRSISGDQNTGMYSCDILIWDLWSLIACEQWLILRGRMSRCAVWPGALWVCIAEGRGGRGLQLGHWQLIRARTLQVVQVVCESKGLCFVCVCACVSRREIANNHSP